MSSGMYAPCYNIGLGSLQKWSVGSIIRGLLLSSEEIVEQVGENIYPLVAPEETKGDFITYTRTGYEKLAVKQGVYQDVAKITLIAVSDNYDDACELASKIDFALTGKHKSLEGVEVNLELVTASEAYQNNKYTEIITYTIK